MDLQPYEGLRHGEIKKALEKYRLYRKLTLIFLSITFIVLISGVEINKTVIGPYYDLLFWASIILTSVFLFAAISNKPLLIDRIFFSICEIQRLYDLLVREKRDQALSSDKHDELKKECKILYQRLKELITELSDPFMSSEKPLNTFIDLYSRKLYPEIINLNQDKMVIDEYLKSYGVAFETKNIPMIEAKNVRLVKDTRLNEVEEIPESLEKSYARALDRIKDQTEPKYKGILLYNLIGNLLLSLIIIELLRTFFFKVPKSPLELAAIVGLTAVLVNQTYKK